MGAIEAIATALSARTVPGISGTILTFRADGVWLTMTGRVTPHLELSMTAPELAGLRLWLQLGPPTLLADEARLDPRWVRRTSDEAWAARLLAETPWPIAAPPPTRGFWATLGLDALSYVTYGMFQPHVARETSPTPRYVLEVVDGTATISQRSNERDDALAVGAARRLVQLVLRTGRLQREAEAEARRPRLRRRGPYR